MPRPLKEELRASMGAVRRTVKRFLREEGDGDFPEYVRNHQLHEAESYIQSGLFPEGGISDEQKQLLELFLQGARDDIYNLYQGMSQFLLEQGLQQHDILPIVQCSTKLARQFGQLSNEEGNANKIALASHENRNEYFELTTNNREELIVSFAPTMLATFKKYMGKEIGCSALSEFVQCPYSGTQVSVYELYWQAFAAQAHDQLLASRPEAP